MALVCYWCPGSRKINDMIFYDSLILCPGSRKIPVFYGPLVWTKLIRARSIGHIWLLWIRVRAFDWSDPHPDPLDRDLVNPATVQYNVLVDLHVRHTESAGTVAVRLRTSCSTCSACLIRIQSSQIRPIERALSNVSLLVGKLETRSEVRCMQRIAWG